MDGQIIDYTKSRKRKGMGVCPKCGRKASIRAFRDGPAMFVHKAKQGGAYDTILEFCSAPLTEE